MKTRIIVGGALILYLVMALWIGGYFILSGFALFSIAAVYETGLALRNKGYRPFLIPAYVFSIANGLAYRFFGCEALIALYLSAVMITMIASLFDKERDAGDTVATLFVYVYPLLPLVCMLLVYFEFDRSVGLTASCLAFAAAEFCDAFAYFGGTLFGKHKLCPSISPKKTVEGSICALLAGVLFGAILIPLQKLWGGATPVSVLLCTGLLTGVFSQFGDLFASKLKRWVGIKDFSSVFPGHGGILDRIDSILFCAPVVLAVFTILSKVGIY